MMFGGIILLTLWFVSWGLAKSQEFTEFNKMKEEMKDNNDGVKN